MSELSSGVSELDARLAEIDTRLSAIQAQLRPDRDAHPVAAAPQSASDPPEPADLMRRLVILIELQERLLRSIGELLASSETALTRPPPPSPQAAVREFTVSAGPFAGTGAVRAFEAMLSGTPGVREVTVRGYDGEDRAIVDVRLADAIS